MRTTRTIYNEKVGVTDTKFHAKLFSFKQIPVKSTIRYRSRMFRELSKVSRNRRRRGHNYGRIKASCITAVQYIAMCRLLLYFVR